MSNEKKRYMFLDEISGLFIIHMILWHCFQNADMMDNSVYRIMSRVFFFFMPWFFYKAGIFFDSRKEIKMVFISSTKRLLVPFLTLFVFGHFCWVFHLAVTSGLEPYDVLVVPLKELLLYGASNGNMALWFLLTLFCVRMIFALVCKGPFHPIIFLVVVLFLLILNSNYGPHKPYYIGNVLLGLFFFSLGNNTFYCLENKNTRQKITIFVSICLYLSVVLWNWTSGDARTNLGRFYEGWLLSSTAGIFMINFFFRVKKMKIPFLAWIGRHSMIYFIFHWPLIILSKTFLVDLLQWDEKMHVLLGIIIFLIITLPTITFLINRRFKWIVGD